METINHAAPTLCMNVPTSETRSAISRLRNVGSRRGPAKLAESRTTVSGLANRVHPLVPPLDYIVARLCRRMRTLAHRLVGYPLREMDNRHTVRITLTRPQSPEWQLPGRWSSRTSECQTRRHAAQFRKLCDGSH